MPMRFPFHTDGRGCTAAAAADDDDYIRDLMEQVLMTSPGERTNRPDFGCGLRGMAFAPAGEALQAALQATVQAALQRWLADLVAVQDVQVDQQEATLHVTVSYVVKRTQEQQVASFQTEEPGEAP